MSDDPQRTDYIEYVAGPDYIDHAGGKVDESTHLINQLPDPVGDEQWHQGNELVVHTGITPEEMRVVALEAAARSWAGLSCGVANRTAVVLKTAEEFETWLNRKGPRL